MLTTTSRLSSRFARLQCITLIGRICRNLPHLSGWAGGSCGRDRSRTAETASAGLGRAPRPRAWRRRQAAVAQIHAQNTAQSWKRRRNPRELRKRAREPGVGGKASQQRATTVAVSLPPRRIAPALSSSSEATAAATATARRRSPPPLARCQGRRHRRPRRHRHHGADGGHADGDAGDHDNDHDDDRDAAARVDGVRSFSGRARARPRRAWRFRQ